MERIKDSRLIACKTRELREIARDAYKLGLNRQMKPAQFKLLDPRGVHIISPQFMHDKANGKPVTPHLRCNVHIKLIGKQGEVEIVMDMTTKFLIQHVDLADAIQKGEEMGAMEHHLDTGELAKLQEGHFKDVKLDDIKDTTQEAR